VGASFPERHWYRFSWLSALLAPLSLGFGAAIGVRRFAYRAGWFRVEQLAVPVVVVGNLVAGGTGKTPLVLWLAAALGARGFRPAIASRGYRGANERPCEVIVDGEPARYGDKPVCSRNGAACRWQIGRDCAAAALVALAAPGSEPVICDDGLQHYALARDFGSRSKTSAATATGRCCRPGAARPAAAWRSTRPSSTGRARAGAFVMQLEPSGPAPRDPDG
jgi:tetraacyldisaccharide 4'-kinase